MKKIILFISCFGVLLFPSCKKNFSGDSKQLSKETIIKLETDSTVLPADGLHFATLTAKISDSSDYREIIFKTSKGKLLQGSSVSSDSLVVTTDVSGKATVRLLADTIAGPAFVTAYVRKKDYHAETSIEMRGLSDYYNSAQLDLTLSDTAMKATLAQTYIIVYANLKNGPNASKINFFTTRGSFLNSSNQKVSSVSVTASRGKTVSVRLLADTLPGFAFLKVISGNLVRDTTVRFKP